MERTQKQLTFDDQAIYSYDVDRYRYGNNGDAVRIRWITNDSRSKCGWKSILPEILPPSGNGYTIDSSSDAVTGNIKNDWSTANPALVNIHDPSLGSDMTGIWTPDEQTTKEYRYGKFNYKINSDNIRQIFHVHVLKETDQDADVSGVVDVFYGNDPVPLQMNFGPNVYAGEIKTKLTERWAELNSNGFKIDVHRGGWCQYGWTFSIHSRQRGRMKDFSVGDWTIDQPNRNKKPYKEVVTQSDPGVVTMTMPGSVTATDHHVPQVVITSNGQRSACDNCDFVYSSMYTPMVTAAVNSNGQVPSSVSLGDALTFTYDLKAYEGTLKDLTFLIGGVAMVNCVSKTLTGVTCDVGPSPEGTHEIVLDLPQVGIINTGFSVALSRSISSHKPTVGSKFGGTIVTVSGTGFGAGQIVTIDIGGSPTECDSTGFDVTYDQLICSTRANSNIADGNTPTLDSVSMNQFSIIGGETFTLSGNGFTNEPDCEGNVFVGNNKAKIISWSDTEIVAETVAGWAIDNNADTKVYVCNKGYTAESNTSVKFQINSVSAAFTSLYGGRHLTITGRGFATDNQEPDTLKVDIGPIPCNIESISKTEIVCQTGRCASNTVNLQIGANAILDMNGDDASDITIEVGQEVHWKWNLQIPGVVPKVRFQQTANIFTPESNNFWSDIFSGSQNEFIKHFDTKGTVVYSTGLIDSAMLYQTGKITVVDPTDKPLKVSVAIDGVEAIHNGNSDNAQPTDACSLSGGSSISATVSEPGFFVTYSWATTPKISGFAVASNIPQIEGIDVFEASSPVAEIQANFVGFNPSSCSENVEVSIAGFSSTNGEKSSFPCTETSVSSVSYSCVINPSEDLAVGRQSAISFAINTMGNAYMFDFETSADENNLITEVSIGQIRNINFGSVANNISPTEVSRFGDAVITIDGFGFGAVEPIAVNMASDAGRLFSCSIQTISYTQIVCKVERIVSDLTISDFDLNLYIETVGGNGDVAEVFWNGLISFKDSKTPKIDNAEPATISTSGETLTLTGSNLAGLNVQVGDETCLNIIVAGDGNSATCTLPALEVGKHSIHFTATNGFVVHSPLYVESVMTVASISPVTGGTRGGQLITVTGFGFSKDTVIQVYTDLDGILCEFCYKESVTPDTIVFYSPLSPNIGEAKVFVSHEYLQSNISPFTYTYTATNGLITGTFRSGVSNLIGGEDLVIASQTIGKCNKMKIEIQVQSDPCAAGQHMCADTSTCTPSSDGTDYSCTCKESDSDYDNYGATCYRISRKDYSDTSEQANTRCTDDRKRLLQVNNKNDEQELIKFLIKTEGSNQRGLFFQWYGTDTCGRLNTAQDAIEFPGACDTWGDEDKNFEKRVLCKTYAYRNCYDSEIDYGRATYNGWYSVANGGLSCNRWDEYKAWNDIKDRTHVKWGGAYCANPHNSATGLLCDGYVNEAGEESTMSCAIPKCSDLESGVTRQQCRIRSVAPIDAENVSGTEYGGPCWLGSMGSNDRVHNPRRCYDGSRKPEEFRFEVVSSTTESYKLVRTSDDYYVYVSDDDKVMRTKADDIINSDKSTWYVEKDVFSKGSFTLRNGNVFLKAPGTLSGNLDLVHENAIHLENTDEISWIIECSDDNYGDLIDQPSVPFAKVAELTPSCNSRNTKMTVSLPSLPAGSYRLIGRNDEYGQLLGSVDINFALSVDSVSPNTVGTGGGTKLFILGSGFSAETTASACGKALTFIDYTDALTADGLEMITFETVPFDASLCASNPLSVSAKDPQTGIDIEAGITARSGFNVDSSLTPKITSVNPKKGGTAGGTLLTITGTGFGSDNAQVQTSIMGVECTVESVSDTEIVCKTGAFPRDQDQVPTNPFVNINGGPGQAIISGINEADTQFWYIDRWSSPYTWGCTDNSCLPQEGEIIVIPAGQVILLDITTPVLAVLIVDGGKFIWDRTDGIELHMQYGVINNGGHFEIGTEDEPFCEGDALIMMYGHQRSINLPIYGAKVLAVRFGTLDIHGCPKTTTWTELDVTVEAGESEITLTHPVQNDWFVGNEIIIAATGDITNFHRSEKRKITSVTNNGYTVGLDEPLEHRHISVCSNGPNNNGQGWGWAGTLCTRAEVGLLTRNVKMMGNFNEDWREELDECELGVGVAFGTQTCFQNRFGHEEGSDQFGSVLFLHKPTYAKIEFFELTHAGQAFNLARYPIHFHTPGSLPTSYVRGCGIHNTFNRALTMHGVHNLTVEFNVIYNVMGLAFFLEDAVEEDNLLRYNLGIMNKKSSSLLNIDSTPAVFWIPNPNNIFYGNRAAGGTHFGFWFNPSDEPTGPSAQDPQYANFCVKNRPLGAFYNNTAHSMGKYGMWIFTDLTPTGPHGLCGETEPKAIKFGELPAENENGPIPANTFGFFAWHCQRGAEFATGGAIQFHNMVVANNWKAGLAGKETFLDTYATPDMEEQASMFKRNIAIGHLDGDRELTACGDMGIETPWERFAFTVDDIQFFNYDNPTPNIASVDLSDFAMAGELDARRCIAFDPCYEPNAFDCGAITWFSKVSWYNSNRRMVFDWEHEAGVLDLDGTFTEDQPNTYVMAHSDAFNKDLCSPDTSEKYQATSSSHPADICVGAANGETFKPHRFMFNGAKPDSLEGMMAVFTNRHGVAKSPFRNCRPRGNGWMVVLDGNEEYEMHFDNMDHISNISFAGIFKFNSYIIISFDTRVTVSLCKQISINYLLSGDIDDFEQGEWLTIRHDFPEKVDYAELNKNSGERIFDEWPSDPLTLDSYNYHINNETGPPYSIRYTFNGEANEANPDIDQHGGALSWGNDFFVKPNFYKCFYKDCIPPPPKPLEPEPEMEDCNMLDCLGGQLPAPNDPLFVSNGARMVIDAAAVASANRHMKFGAVFIEGTLEIAANALQAGETLIIEADNLILNTGMGNATDALSTRRKRDIEYINNGKLVIGTKDNPIPCDRTVEIKINGDQFSTSYGALAGLPPIGPKALGGFGGIEMHGCAPANTWTTLVNTINQGDDSITVNDDITGWKVRSLSASTDETLSSRKLVKSFTTKICFFDPDIGRNI